MDMDIIYDNSSIWALVLGKKVKLVSSDDSWPATIFSCLCTRSLVGRNACVAFDPHMFPLCIHFQVCRDVGISADVAEKLCAMAREAHVKELLKSRTQEVVDFGVSSFYPPFETVALHAAVAYLSTSTIYPYALSSLWCSQTVKDMPFH